MIIFLFLTDSTVYRQCNRQDTCTINEVYILYVRNNAVVYSPLWRPDNQITMVFLILTFYLRLFAGFADIVDYLPIRYRRRYRNGKYRQNRRIGGIGSSPNEDLSSVFISCV